MENLIDILFSKVNITLTILSLVLILYWIITMFSGLDFDVDVDVDMDVDMDANIEGGNMDFEDVANAEVNKEDVIPNRRKNLKWWQVVLVYFNFIGLPFMFTFTSWIFIWWIGTAIATVLTGSTDNSFGFILMIAGIIPSLILTKMFTTPFKGFFKNLNADGDLPIDIVGREGVSLSNIKENKLGSAEVKAAETPLAINIKAWKGEAIAYRDKILIIEQSPDKTFYYAKKYQN